MVAAFLLFTFPFFLLLTGQAPVGKSLSILYKSNDRLTKTIIISDQLRLRALLSRAGVFQCIFVLPIFKFVLGASSFDAIPGLFSRGKLVLTRLFRIKTKRIFYQPLSNLPCPLFNIYYIKRKA